VSRLDYANVTNLIGFLVDSKSATLAELQSVYSLEDAFVLAEIYQVNAYNRANTKEV